MIKVADDWINIYDLLIIDRIKPKHQHLTEGYIASNLTEGYITARNDCMNIVKKIMKRD